MVVTRPFWGFHPGQDVPKATFSRRRLWWRRGWIACRSELSGKDQKEIEAKAKAFENSRAPELQARKKRHAANLRAAQEKVGISPPPQTEPPQEEPPREALSAEEGAKGWWNVLFDDGSEMKMRRDDVIALGLLEQANGEG